METTNYMLVVPGSSFTIGDLIEVEIKDADGNWNLTRGRITNDVNNAMLITILEVDENGNLNFDAGGFTSFHLKDLEMRNSKVLEKGPWHNLICGED